MSGLLSCRFPVRIGLALLPRTCTSRTASTHADFAVDAIRHLVPARSAALRCNAEQAVSRGSLDKIADEKRTVRTGQVISSEANFLRVKLASLPDQEQSSLTPQLLCQVRGLLKKKQERVLVGDHVQVGAINWKENRGMVEAVLPRTSQLTDPAVANVNNVVLLFSFTNPPFEEEQVSRFLVSVESTQLPLTLILNKGDLVDEETRQQIVDTCRSWGYEPFVVSCSSGAGVREVSEELKGKVSVVAGPSGVGKSSLINVLRLGRHRREEVEDEEDGDTHGATVEPERSSHTVAPSTCNGAAAHSVHIASGEDESSVLLRSSRGSSGTVSSCTAACNAEGVMVGSQQVTTQQHLLNSAVQSRDVHHQPQHPPHEACSSDGLHTYSSQEDADTRIDAGIDFVSVGELSKIKRGTHTTRTVSLLQLPGGGLLADSPGFNQPSLDKVATQDLSHCFPEMRALVEEEGCRFRDCLHIQEPGCCVNEAGLQRWPFYLKLLAEVQAREQHEEEVLQLSKRTREGNTKVKIGRGGSVRHELRLSAKKHRRVARNKATQEWQQALDE